MITYQSEPFSAVIREATPLLERHWKEIALFQDKIPFSPQFDLYYAWERLGRLEIITARSNGILVGYIGQILGPGVHCSQTLWSLSDLIWLDPAYREGWTGVKLIREMEKRLRERGVKVFELQPKLHFEKDRGGLQKILKYLDFEEVATVHVKLL